MDAHPDRGWRAMTLPATPAQIVAIGRFQRMRFARHESGRVPTHTEPSCQVNQISAFRLRVPSLRVLEMIPKISAEIVLPLAFTLSRICIAKALITSSGRAFLSG